MATLVKKTSHGDCKRFLHSYGVWMSVAKMLTQKELVCLQALCRYLYFTGVPRIISKFLLPSLTYYITKPDYWDSDSIVVAYNSRFKTCSWVNSPLLQLACGSEFI